MTYFLVAKDHFYYNLQVIILQRNQVHEKHPSSLQSFADIPTHFSHKDQTLEIEGGLSGL